MFFCTFLCSCCMTTMWNFLISQFIEVVNTRQQFFSFFVWLFTLCFILREQISLTIIITRIGNFYYLLAPWNTAWHGFYSINSKLHAKIVCIVNIVCWLEFQYFWILCSHCCRLGIILHQTGMGHNHSHGMGSSHGHGHSHSSNKEESIRRISRSNSLRHSEKQNINVRAAFIHVLGDIVQSVGVLIAAYIIKFKVIQRM